VNEGALKEQTGGLRRKGWFKSDNRLYLFNKKLETGLETTNGETTTEGRKSEQENGLWHLVYSGKIFRKNMIIMKY